jgi:hypothetical protein
LPSRGRAGAAHYFEALREASGRLAAGLIRLGEPAAPAEIAAAERELGRPLPHPLAELLRSFNGVDLFGESVLLPGVGQGLFGTLTALNRSPRPDRLAEGELLFAHTSEGDLLALESEPAQHPAPRVFCLRPDADERWLAGSSLASWLDATVAREEILYDGEGEFRLEAFEPDGEVTAACALKQAERAARKDPGSALAQYELGLALRRLRRPERSRDAFARACQLQPDNPWPAFDLGRAQHGLDEHAAAAGAFQQAAAATPGPAGARFLAWAARCLVEQKDRAAAAEADRLLSEARQRHPGLADDLSRAADAEADDPGAAGDAQELARLLRDDVPLGRRLPLLPSPAKPPPRR